MGAPACGDVMKLQIKVDKDGKIIESKFKTFGCGSAIASSSVATEWLKGKTVGECLEIKNTDIAAHLKLPPVKLHCRYEANKVLCYSTTISVRFTPASGTCDFFPLATHALFPSYLYVISQQSMLAEDAIKAAVKDLEKKKIKA